MAEDAKRQNQLIETTDCLEAIGTLKNNKNLFFFIILICLLILQGIFWLTPTRYVEIPGENPAKETSSPAAMLLNLASPAKKTVTVERKTEKIEKAAQQLTADVNAPAAEPNAAPAKFIPSINIKIRFAQLSWLIRLCNFVLIVCCIIYSLTLLFCLKISLVGRLGGIRHITKAVFISFWMVVIILPWQLLFKEVIVGAVYTPAELLDAWTNFDRAAALSVVKMFLRFTGLWLVVVILLFWAQLKSMRWSKNTLKRLGIIA